MLSARETRGGPTPLRDFQDRSRWYEARRRVSPERDQQATRDRDDANASGALPAGRKPCSVPLRERASDEALRRTWRWVGHRVESRQPSRSVSRSSAPVGKPGLIVGTGYSLTAPVFGSSFPRNCSPTFENHTMPSASTITSCGSIVFRGRLYSVMITRVAARPHDAAASSANRVRPTLCFRLIAIVREIVGAGAEAPHQVRRGDAPLRKQRKALIRVRRHPLEHVHELLRVVLRSQRSLERVAVRAARELLLLILRARNAREPFRVGELRREVVRLAQREVRARGRAGLDLRGFRFVELVYPTARMLSV